MDLERAFTAYLDSRQLREQAESMEGKYKRLLMEEVESHGEADDNGSQRLDLQIHHAGTDTDYVGIKRERRVSRLLDEDAAVEFLKGKGLLERCIKTIEVFDEDELLALAFSEEISDDDLRQLYSEKITWAFKPLKG